MSYAIGIAATAFWVGIVLTQVFDDEYVAPIILTVAAFMFVALLLLL